MTILKRRSSVRDKEVGIQTLISVSWMTDPGQELIHKITVTNPFLPLDTFSASPGLKMGGMYFFSK